MFLSAIAAAALLQAAPATAAQPAAVTAVPALKDIPGVTITYFDIAGTDEASIRSSLAAQTKGAATSWNLSASISKRTLDGKCTIEGITPKFTGTASLPRLATPQAVKPEMLANWQNYVAGLERNAAAQLDFVHSRLGQVQQGVVGASCDEASAKLNAAVDKLKAEEAVFAKQQAARVAAEAKAAEEANKAAQKAAAKKPQQ